MDYVGNATTVTDQHDSNNPGRARKSVTDAIGRVTAVYEDSSALNYQTSYTYDVLDNLLTVTQGGQTRTFVYNSLSRLASATSPEGGTVGYTYDLNGNLRTRTDARGVTATYDYDTLNRNTAVSYAGGGATTPTVTRFYDTATNGLGRLEHVETATTSTTRVVEYDEMGRPTQTEQKFWWNNAWGKA